METICCNTTDMYPKINKHASIAHISMKLLYEARIKKKKTFIVFGILCVLFHHSLSL